MINSQWQTRTDANGQKGDGWTTIQIVVPIIVAVAVALIAAGFFILYRRSLKKRYTPLPEPNAQFNRTSVAEHQTRPSVLQHHQQSSSSSTLSFGNINANANGLANANERHDGPQPLLKKSKVAVAWERAHLQAPRRLGGLLADRPKVHTRKRGEHWNIDSDSDAEADVDGTGIGTRRAKEGLRNHAQSQARASQTSLASTIVRLGRSALGVAPATSASGSGHGRSESQLGLLSPYQLTSPSGPGSNTVSPPLRPHQTTSTPSSPPSQAQVSPQCTPERQKTIIPGSRFFHGIVTSLRRDPAVSVVPGTRRRGFDIDDEDKDSPVSRHDHSHELGAVKAQDGGSNDGEFVQERKGDRGSRSGTGLGTGTTPDMTEEGFVIVGGRRTNEEHRNVSESVNSRTASPNLLPDTNLEAMGPERENEARPNILLDANGDDARIAEERTQAKIQERLQLGEGADVMLISRQPGQDFNSVSLMSPVTAETPTEGFGLGAFVAPTEVSLVSCPCLP
jgi:hypothetical protein